MNLNKSRVAIVLSLIISCFLAICTALTQPVNAYFNKKFDDGSGNKNIQCFDVRFEKPEEYIDGTGVTVISSNLICAQVHKKGIATKIYLGDEHAKDATAGYPKFNIDENTGLKTTISIQRCDNNANNAGIGGGLFACIRDGKTGKVITDSKTFTYDKKGEQTFEDFAKGMYDYINGLDNLYPISDFTDKATTKSHTEIENEENGQKDSEPSCYTEASSLGWILCPILSTSADMLQGIYHKLIQPFLEIETELLSSDDSTKGTYGAWQMFQNIANIVFVILIMIVILSQITGFGISNYGIKKTLPKLIVVAILVNLSYIICQLAVDISNILGYGLESLFNNFATQIEVKPVGVLENVTDLASGTAATVFTVLIGVLSGAAIWKLKWLIIIPLVLSVITAVIAVVFFFIILGVRKAGVVLLVAISPLAIVCYALPNTSKLFQKWYKAFTSLLLVFPICGILIGGGNFASRLLLSANPTDDNFFTSLIAMLVCVVPFFFVPSILKNSLSAIGNLGAKISAFGGRMSNRLTGAARNSELVKGVQREATMKYHADTFNRLNNRTSRIPGMTKINKIRSNASRKAYNRMALEDIEAGGANEGLYTPDSDTYQRKLDEQRRGVIAEQYAHSTADEVLNALEQALIDDDYVAAPELFRRAEDTGQIVEAYRRLENHRAPMSDKMRQELGVKMLKGEHRTGQLYGKYLAKGGKGTFSDFLNGTSRDKDGNLSTLATGIADQRENALVGQDKDELKFLSSHMQEAGINGSQVARAAVSAEGEALSRVDDMVSQMGSEFAKSLSADQIANIKESTVDAAFNNGAIIQDFKDSILGINQPQNASLRAKMDPNTRRAFEAKGVKFK